VHTQPASGRTGRKDHAIELRGMGINWRLRRSWMFRETLSGTVLRGWDESPDGTVPMVKARARFSGTDLSAPCAVAASTKHMAGVEAQLAA